MMPAPIEITQGATPARITRSWNPSYNTPSWLLSGLRGRDAILNGIVLALYSPYESRSFEEQVEVNLKEINERRMAAGLGRIYLTNF